MDKGAHYYYCDFQVHTPRDQFWSGKRYVTEEERNEYAQHFIKTCREKGLQAVAITEHHDTLFYKYIRNAALSEITDNGVPVDETNRIIVFPGIEVSIAQPSAQVLILFDPEIDITLFNQVPIRLGITPAPDNEAITCEIRQLNISVQEIHERLCESPELTNKFIILPHVTPGGHKTFMRNGNHTIFSNLPCVGGYIEGMFYKDLDQGKKNILEGRDSSWSSRAYGVFQTSDCRQDDLSTLGKYPTWVKWSKPSAEALRQACLSKSNRISHHRPAIPNIYIERVEVSDSKFLGPIHLEINLQFTALIGGRGTGKSSFLEYLKWGLCDPSVENTFDSESRTIEKKRSDLLASTLESVGASVTIQWVSGKVKHIVKRDTLTNTIELTIGSQAPRQASIQEIRELIGIQSYSQKQLSTVGVDINELRRFIETPISPELKTLADQMETLYARIRQDVFRLQDKKRIYTNISIEKATLVSLKEQANTIRDQLQGLPDDSKRTVEQQPLYEQEAQYLNRIRDKLGEIKAGIETLRNSVTSLVEPITIKDLPNGSLIEALHNQITESANYFNEGLDSLEKRLFGDTNQKPSWCILLEEWEDIYKLHSQKLQEAIVQNIQYQQQLSNLNEKEEEIREKETLISKYETELGKMGNPEEDVQKNMAKLLELYETQRQLLAEQCSRLNQLSGGLIDASLATAGDLDEHHSMLVGTVQGSNISADKLRRLLDQLESSNAPFETWRQIVSEIYSIWTCFEEGGSDFAIPEVSLLKKGGLIDSELRRLASRIDTEKYIALLLYKLKEKPIFKYCIPGGDVIDFDQASAGQQASALLKILLSIEGPPLIIDQPEDDLDNEIVAEIANHIWEAKKKRQLIFASHNANLVVNGDAELVVHFGYRNEGDQSTGQIKTIGSIDVPDIKEAIKNVMEGGEMAFKLRQEKYGF